MKPIFAAPAGLLAKKPPHGSPCNRCGLCCMATLCDLGQHVLKQPALPGPCPALEQVEDGSFACGLVAHTERYASQRQILVHGLAALRQAALWLIGSGDGCDARFNGEPRNKAFADALDKRWRSGDRARQARVAKRIWGAKP